MDLHENQTYLANLRGADNQLLSTGKALVHKAQSYAAFWPQPGADVENLLKNGARLEIQGADTFALTKIERCPNPSAGHLECFF